MNSQTPNYSSGVSQWVEPFEAASNPVLDYDDLTDPAQPVRPHAGPKPRYEILSAIHALQPQPPINWVVGGLISAGSVNMFFGEGGSKKTYALVDMGVCVATGKDWITFKTQPGNVLIVDEESGRRRILGRLGDVLRGHNADYSTPVFCVSLAAFNLGLPNDIGELYNLIVTTRARLVIIDALADVMPGRDENAVKDTQPIFLALRRIAEDTQAAIIIIHHSNKGGTYRGSTAMKGAVDLLLEVTSKTGSDEIVFKTEKARDTTATTFAAKAVFMQDSFWLTGSTASTNRAFSKGQKYVLSYLLANGEDDIDIICNNADTCAPATAKSAIYSLTALNLTRRTNPGSKGINAKYDLTDEGKNAAITV
jgi:hypothetical protein